MTTVLKDSLGGNCLTVMIANINCDAENYDETISTLRFSQRVGKIENEVIVIPLLIIDSFKMPLGTKKLKIRYLQGLQTTTKWKFSSPKVHKNSLINWYWYLSY